MDNRKYEEGGGLRMDVEEEIISNKDIRIKQRLSGVPFLSTLFDDAWRQSFIKKDESIRFY